MSDPKFEKSAARSGDPTLRLHLDGESLQVHSAFDPRREAHDMLGRMPLEGRPLLVILGGGLGYLARAAADLDLAGILVLEPAGVSPPCAEGPGTSRAGCGGLGPGQPASPGRANLLKLSGPPDELLDRITREQIRLGYPDLVMVANAAYQRAWPRWAGPILEKIPVGRTPSLFASLRQRTSWSGRKVLVIQSGYFLLRECIDAFGEIGCEVAQVPLNSRGHLISPTDPYRPLDPDPDFLERLLQCIATFRPEFVFVVNHIGFDREGRLLDLLDSMRIPLAVWYVDSPGYIIDRDAAISRESTFLFVWEKAWIDVMKDRGFEHVYPLPLAGNPAFLRKEARPLRDFGFAGGANVFSVRKWRGKLDLPARLDPCYRRMLEAYRSQPPRELPESVVSRALSEEPELQTWLDPQRRQDLESLLVLETTRLDRLDLVRRFKGLDFLLVGGDDWRILDPKLEPAPPVDYYDGLADHYGENRVNLNSTSRQMPTSTNQRAFDVPLAGACVLNDWREDLEELFEPGRDCICYRHVDELPDLAERLARDETWRASIVDGARRTILDRHLYRHRLEFVVQKMKEVLDG